MSRETYPPLIPNVPRLLHGGDYNPEQWPSEIWLEDSVLMAKAHWNSVTVGVFSWVTLESEEGKFNFEWLDRIMDLQAQAGRTVGLATPSATQPAWMSKKYPEILRTNPGGIRRKHGNRVNTCYSSPVYRQKTREMAALLAERYANHPALAYWHVSNELCGECHCNLCQEKFRQWLEVRYGTLEKLNAAYWSAFWGHTYTSWDQIESPGEPIGDTAIVALSIDWKRFCTDQIVDFYLNEANALREVSPRIPITTNLMGTHPGLDAFKIAPHVDFASWDSYPWFYSTPGDIGSWVYVSFCHDLNRGLKSGKPFLLMECSPSASNWYSTMGLKRPNAHALEGLQAVAHGADGVQYFQWRQGLGGIEQYHGAVLAHNNRTDVKVFRDVAALGETMEQLDAVCGSRVDTQVALIFDWENAWAIDATSAPTTEKKNYTKTIIDHYRPLWGKGFQVDILDSNCDFSGYKLLIAPMLYMLKAGIAERIAGFVETGGTLITTYWSGMVDESALAFHGGYPEPLRSVLGIWSEEIDALYPDQHNEVIATGGFLSKGSTYTASELCERIHVETAEVLATYGHDFYAGEPALTRNRYGKGQAIFVASRNEPEFTSELLALLCQELSIEPCVKGEWPAGVTVQCRRAETADYLFVLNCSDEAVNVTLDEPGLTDTLAGTQSQTMSLPPFGSKVLVRSLEPEAVSAVFPRLSQPVGN